MTGPHTFRFGQENLATLCRDRPLRTAEIHKYNDFYGHAAVLKRYARVPQWYPLKVVLEHSLLLYETVCDYDVEQALPINLSYSPWRGEVLQQATGRPTIPIGFTLWYAARLWERLVGDADSPRSGTIVFPYKSSLRHDTVFDHDDYARRLATLPAKMKPIVVCIYWKDHLRGVHEAYRKQGFRIVSAGHIYDPQFYVRLYDMCRQCRWAVSNEFGSGTHVFASVAAGCSFGYVESTQITRAGKEFRRDKYSENLSRLRSRSLELFGEPRDEVSPEQRRFVDEVLGTGCLKTPDELRRIFWQAEWSDKFRRLPHSSACHPAARWSPFVERQVRRVQGIHRSLQKRLPWTWSRGVPEQRPVE